MKPALRLIPTEVWVDVFCYPWISRRKLGRIVDRFRNSYFVEILQYCLHERGKRTLGVMRLDNEKSLPLIPMTPMPDNIKFFNLIIIGHYDSTTIDFLRRINTLFTGVNLFSNGIHPAEIRTILDRISPLIHGIHSLRFEDFEIPVIEQYFAPKLAQVKMIELHTDSLDSIQQTTINFCMNWLEQRDQMEPRLLKVHIASKNFQKFSDAIQQSAFTFAIRLPIWRIPDRDYSRFANFELKNNLGEQLHGRFGGAATFQINRHQPNAGNALQEWVEETVKKSDSSSRLSFYHRIGTRPFDANVGANGVNIVEAVADDQPSTSGDKQCNKLIWLKRMDVFWKDLSFVYQSYNINMKPGLRWIPTEVWVDVLCLPWISRKELGRIVDQFRNAYFVEILQYCLHERGKRTLGDMHLDEKLWPYIIPQTPMPDNIKFFNFIIFSHFDSRTIDFLRSISTLFTGVNMTLDDLPPAELRTVLEHLSPLIHGIHSLTLDQWAIPLMEEYFAPKLAQIKMLKIAIDSCHSQPTIDFALNWLTSGGQRDQIEPKVLKLHIPLLKDVQQFIVAILKQFHSAKSLSTFAIQFKIWRAPIADFDLENSLGEQLRGQCDSDREHFQISRHQPNAGKAVQEWVQETVQKSRRSSCLAFYDLTIGPLDANAGDNGNGMNIVEAEADQPSTSGCSIN